MTGLLELCSMPECRAGLTWLSHLITTSARVSREYADRALYSILNADWKTIHHELDQARVFMTVPEDISKSKFNTTIGEKIPGIKN